MYIIWQYRDLADGIAALHYVCLDQVASLAYRRALHGNPRIRKANTWSNRGTAPTMGRHNRMVGF